MAKREIKDWQGRSAGERIARYVWRSKPTRSPITDRPIRCIVAQDEKGQYWAGTRTGRGDGQKAQYELWETCATKQEAMAISRQQVRMLLSTQAEMYSNTVKGKQPGELIVRVEMDDGWKSETFAAEKPPVRDVFQRLERKSATKEKQPPKGRDRGWPSR